MGSRAVTAGRDLHPTPQGYLQLCESTYRSDPATIAFHDTVDGGWSGPKATMANKRATGMAWAMAQRLLGHGVWRPAERR